MSSSTIYWRPTWGGFLHSNDERGDPSTAREARWKQKGRNQTYRTSRNNLRKESWRVGCENKRPTSENWCNVKRKAGILIELDEQILAVCKVEEIEKEIDETETFKMRIMDTRADISTRTTPPVTKVVPSEITTPAAQVHTHVESPEHPPASSGFTNQGIQPFTNPFSSHHQSTLKAKLPYPNSAVR